MKNICTSLLLLIFFLSSNGQPVFTYGPHAVNKTEFLSAFQKNNEGQQPTEKALREYLDLYIRYRLKVQAAYDLKLDKAPAQQAELNDFRNQVIESYLTDEATSQALVNEALVRSRKDIRLGHIYIPLDPERPFDTTKAWKMATDAYNELQRGSDFGNVAAIYSADSTVRRNKGDIGFITVLTLPYELESLAYSTAPGEFSRPFRSKAAYHIFKNLGERPAMGRIRAAQILLGFPPEADDATKLTLAHRADSIHRALSGGASFNELVFRYSTDNTSYNTQGELQEFGVGRYDVAFENAVLSLQPGELSKPVLTAHGYHIVKRMGRQTPAVDSASDEELLELKRQIEMDQRMNLAREVVTKRILNVVPVRMGAIKQQHLFAYADSAMQLKKLPVFPNVSDKTLLFSFPKKNILVGDWIRYLRDIRDVPVLTEGKSMATLLQQYKEMVITDYYRSYMEEHNPAFARQLKEFKEGNMLFEVMQRNVWEKAAADSAALRAYFQKNRSRYTWTPSASVILFSASDSVTAAQLKTRLIGNISAWRAVANSFDGKVQADSGRYELSQLPLAGSDSLRPGSFVTMAGPNPDGVISLLYILRVHPGNQPRVFEDARGFVLNDYQTVLEEKWIDELKKKYPVKVNSSVLASLAKQ